MTAKVAEPLAWGATYNDCGGGEFGYLLRWGLYYVRPEIGCVCRDTWPVKVYREYRAKTGLREAQGKTASAAEQINQRRCFS